MRRTPLSGRPRRWAAVTAAAAAALALAACASGPADGSELQRSAVADVEASASASSAAPSTSAPSPSRQSPRPVVTATVAPTPSPDQLAGVLARTVPDVGDGRFRTVPGAASAPRDGELRRVRVSVEGGLPADGDAFADFVMRTLNDRRSWAGDGYAFARTDGEHDTEVVLASPRTSEQLCRPLQTMGTLSCRNGSRVILTWYRWVEGHEDFPDLTSYRQYLVNHEVGHSLGHSHESCPGAGERAPVMMQQTKGVRPCVANAWPQP